MLQLTHADSPLAKTRKHAPVRIARSSRQLSQEDQATLRRILDEKYDCIHHELFELPAAEARRSFGAVRSKVPTLAAVAADIGSVQSPRCVQNKGWCRVPFK